MEQSISSTFGHRIRIRACGLLETESGILLIKHNSLGPLGYLWSAPGGEPHFEEPIQKAVEREFLEETSLIVKCGEFLLFNEFIGNHLHAVELFFKVTLLSGSPILGHDPELPPDKQMMSGLRFWSRAELAKQNLSGFHAMFSRPGGY